MEGMEELSDFFVKTRGHCFLCLIKVEPELERGSGSLSNEPIHYLSLSTYLNLTMIIGRSSKEAGIETKRLKLRVTLCEVCAPINEQFLEAYEQLKRIEMEVATCLNLVRNKISNAEQIADHWRREAGGEGKELEIMEELRRETMEKCFQKLTTLSHHDQQLPKQNHPIMDRTEAQEEAMANLNLVMDFDEDDDASQIDARNENEEDTLPKAAADKSSDPDIRSNRRNIFVENSDSDSDFILDDDDVNEDDDSDGSDSEDSSHSSLQNLDADKESHKVLPASGSSAGSDRSDNDETNGDTSFQQKSHTIASSSKKLGRPKIMKNPKSKKYNCDLCPKEYSDRKSLRAHYDSVHLNIRYECGICNKMFRYRRYYKRHQREFHLGVDGKSFKCPNCNESFLLKSELKEHQQTSGCKTKAKQSSKTLVKHICSICGKQSNTRSHLKKHVDTVHLKLREHVCTHCGKGFGAPDHLQRHLNSVHFNLREHICEQCGKGFATNYHLTTHRTTVHGGLPRQIICDQCGKGFKTSSDLRKHVEQVHLRVRDYKCDLCEENFTGKLKLNSHRRRVHGEGVKPPKDAKPRKKNRCPCPHCPKVFSQNSDVTRHIKGVHLQLREHSCEKCHQTFKRNWHLMKHRCNAGIDEGPS